MNSVSYAIILAGGQGIRMGASNVPKQFVKLAGKPMILYSLEAAQSNANIDYICVAAPSAWQARIKTWAAEYGIDKFQYTSASGRERRQTVYTALKCLPAKVNDIVMIMTAVCPFVSQATIDKHFVAMHEYDACITVVRATDAITFSNEGRWAGRTLQKKNVFIQQGPQTFRYGVIKAAHDMYERDMVKKEVNEDSELVLDMGIKTFMVFGDRFCIKVTYPEDLVIAEALSPLFLENDRSERSRTQVNS
ncbi:MAG: 2-C-methyl-D-erythritol 4-phosphate cytidylyltransferase [Desulfarculales bacterium]|jgi:2-C-methyl-D-erythritol 4-phosphate cytidylyltransferase|nr:2-C-methyl-D-erythritol 4-phosphate cytidylyltransferase [Desulfarculales bacterium]